MKLPILLALNAVLVAVFVLAVRRRDTLGYYFNGKFWLTWFSIAIITLMDELTSVFYAPAEAFRYIGPSAVFFIAFTAIFVHYMTTRFVEIAEILEGHGVFGGGVYSFSYLVLGPTISFVAVSSIMVDYILTACISSVSAIENATSFLQFPFYAKMGLSIGVIWGVAGLNILGIKENARFTFGVFILASFVLLNLIASGILSFDGTHAQKLEESFTHAYSRLQSGSLHLGYGIFIASMASCVLAYSGVESVLQTASLVRTWREIGKAYLFLAFTVGLATPVLAALALSAPIDLARHEGDLITHYATITNGLVFGITVAALASLTLIMAVNTAFVASSELLERVAHRYGFHWIIATNRRHSLYRVHILNAVFFSSIIVITHGSQAVLAGMYALGLVASFCVNMGCLLIYRYFMGTKEVVEFNTSRVVTLVMFLILVSCFIFLAWMKPHGTELWAVVTGVVLLAGLFVAKTRSPEARDLGETDSQMDVVLFLAESTGSDLHIYFLRPRDEDLQHQHDNEVYVSFYNPRHGAPAKLSPNHFRLAAQRRSVYQQMIGLLQVVEYELGDRDITVHYGWPLSSWVDRLSIGVLMYNIMKLPRRFQGFRFLIEFKRNLSRFVESSGS